MTTRSVPRIGNATIPKLTVDQTVEILRTTAPSTGAPQPRSV